MVRRYVESIHPLLEQTFLLLISFTITTQIGTIIFVGYRLYEAFERCRLFSTVWDWIWSSSSSSIERKPRKTPRSTTKQHTTKGSVKSANDYQTAKRLFHGQCFKDGDDWWQLLKCILFECCKLHLMIMAFKAVTLQWKIANLFIFDAIYLMIILFMLVAPDQVGELADWRQRRGDTITPLTGHDRAIHTLFVMQNAIICVTYFVAVLCSINFAYIYWDTIVETFQMS